MDNVENNIVLNNQNAITDIENDFENFTLIEVNKKIYAIKTENVLEIEKIIELDYAHNLPSCILGFMKYDDIPIGVIDLREIFKEERIVYDLNTKLVIIKQQEALGAIACDSIIDIKRVQKNKIHPVPFSDENSLWLGTYSENTQNIYIIDPKKVIDEVNNHPEKYISDGSSNTRYIVSDDKSKNILKERREVSISVRHDIQFTTPLYDMGVSFIINNIKYYITLASVKEFYKVNNSKFIKIPNTPDFVFGLINIKGEYITVIDIRNFYTGAKTEIKEKSTIIILKSSEFKIGILADEILESMNINFDKLVQNKIQKQDDSNLSEFVKDNEIYQIIDTEKLMKDDRLTIC